MVGGRRWGVVLALAVVVAGGGGVLALVLGTLGERRGAAAPRPGGGETSAEMTGSWVADEGAERRSAADVGAAGSPGQGSGGDEGGGAGGDEEVLEGSLRVRLASAGGEPLEGVRVAARLAGEDDGGRRLVHVDRPRGTRGEVVRTDLLGQAVLFVPPGREGALVAWTDDGSVETGRAEFAALEPLERREVRLVLRTAEERRLAGRVVAAADGRPLGGAVVSVQTAGRVGEVASCGPDGGFEVRAPPRGAGLLRAEGFTPALAPATAAAVRRIALGTSATLEVTVASPTDVPAPDCEVFVRGDPAGLLVPGSRGAPLPPLDEVPLGTEERRGTTDEWGRAVVEDLPAGTPLRVRVRGEPFGLLEETVAPLEPGGEGSLHLAYGRPVALEGRLLDREGNPIAGQEVWCKHVPRGTEARFFDCADRDALSAFADGGGRFQFAEVYGGTVLVGSAVQCTASLFGEAKPTNRRTRNANGVATLATPVRVPHVRDAGDVRTVNVELRRDVALGVSGRVVDAEGEPFRGADVGARSLDHPGGGWGDWSGSGGRFSVGPLARGGYELVAHSPRTEATSPPRVVRAGTDDVELVLGEDPERRTLVGFVLDEGRAPLDAQVWWDTLSPQEQRYVGFRYPPTRAETAAWGSAFRSGPMARPRTIGPVRTDPAGRFEIELPEGGTNRLLARTMDGSRAGATRVVVPDGACLEGLEIVLGPPGRLRVVERREAGEDAARPWWGSVVLALGGYRVGAYDPGEYFEPGEAFAVPSGRFTALLDGGGVVRLWEVEIPPGGEVVLGCLDGPGGPARASSPR